jgi:hypothetical protein
LSSMASSGPRRVASRGEPSTDHSRLCTVGSWRSARLASY